MGSMCRVSDYGSDLRKCRLEGFHALPNTPSYTATLAAWVLQLAAFCQHHLHVHPEGWRRGGAGRDDDGIYVSFPLHPEGKIIFKSQN